MIDPSRAPLSPSPHKPPDKGKDSSNKKDKQPDPSSPGRRHRRLRVRRARPALFPPVLRPVRIHFLRRPPSCTDVPYPGAPEVGQHCLCGLLFPQPLARWGSRVFPPVCLPNVLPKRPDLRKPGPALCEKVVAGLSLSSTTPPALVTRSLVNLVLQVRANRRVAG